jgi:Mg2+ and Co2+ transporter CorA
MMWTYTVTEKNELFAQDVDSQKGLEKMIKESNWVWIDMMQPDEKEFDMIQNFIKEPRILEEIKEKKSISRPEKMNDFTFFSVSQAIYDKKLHVFPVYVLTKANGIFITIRSKSSSQAFKNALKTFEDCVGKVCEGDVNSLFLLGRLFHELTNENLDTLMDIREHIDSLEQKALENPGNKEISRSVFVTKRVISTLERVLWSQREQMLNIREGVVLMIKATEEIETTLNFAINNISRELSFLTSENYALDSILSLQDLGMIHRVEKRLIVLSFLALIVSILLIFLELDIMSLLR